MSLFRLHPDCLIVCGTHQLIVGIGSPLRLLALFLPNNDLATLASSTAPSLCPLSNVSVASFGAVSAPFVNSRAESHAFWNTELTLLVLSLPTVDAVDKADERIRTCRASWAPCNLLVAGFLPPHCSHALITTIQRVMFLSMRITTVYYCGPHIRSSDKRQAPF